MVSDPSTVDPLLDGLVRLDRLGSALNYRGFVFFILLLKPSHRAEPSGPPGQDLVIELFLFQILNLRPR